MYVYIYIYTYMCISLSLSLSLSLHIYIYHKIRRDGACNPSRSRRLSPRTVVHLACVCKLHAQYHYSHRHRIKDLHALRLPPTLFEICCVVCVLFSRRYSSVAKPVRSNNHSHHKKSPGSGSPKLVYMYI